MGFRFLFPFWCFNGEEYYFEQINDPTVFSISATLTGHYQQLSTQLKNNFFSSNVVLLKLKKTKEVYV